MTDRLEEIRARAEAATPGPWRWRGLLAAKGSEQTYAGYPQRVFGRNTDPVDTSPALIAETFDGHSDTAPPNADFIAHAREDIPYLLAEIERLRAALEVTLPYAMAHLEEYGFSMKYNDAVSETNRLNEIADLIGASHFGGES